MKRRNFVRSSAAAKLADLEWQKLRARPGLSDAEIVSNIHSAILRPLANSPIR